ncbi:phosphoenolpyruvate--protein phosphotransferase [Marinobacterium sedimentorum]|uniref:phosphoenolpyruvate--protein phosphotransferase n=1 Tax=Marinobacterium sedimentorum TaxID=2927804 RepID=UPI0020C665DE|nr:phosphoenolpyruvate--protein phosphotransferase [Marinobacterium sedimentorum]MCP8687472.1 phosphoenolpyruvate--protein phosphotransferase [Marinobacterium sedimentorum]
MSNKTPPQNTPNAGADSDRSPAIGSPASRVPARKSAGALKKLTELHQIIQQVSQADSLESALQAIVSGVRNTLHTDACAVYLSDQAHSHYVLMASEGLNAQGAGKLHLRQSTGLVGWVAERREAVNVRNAPAHPRFCRLQGTDEEAYHGFLGVPIIHRQQLLGVLVAQQLAQSRFKKSEQAFLATLATQLAGTIALSLSQSALQGSAPAQSQSPSQYEGGAGAPGIAMGTGVLVFSTVDLDQVPDRTVEDSEAEIAALQAAVDGVAADFELLAERLEPGLSAEDRALFRAYALIARSQELFDATVNRIRHGNWAPGALRESILEHVRLFEAMDDPYLRERAHDIRDIGHRLLARLLPGDATGNTDYPPHTILIGEHLSPVDLAAVPAERLAGVVSGHGSSLSHLAILARSMEVPAIMGITGDVALGELDGTSLIVDGYQGRLYLNPGESLQKDFRRVQRQEQKLSEELQSLRDLPAETLDGVRMPLYTNAGLLSDLSHSLSRGSEGIGLYRTEFPFMVRNSFPTEDEQYLLYRQVLEAFHPRPVTLRTLDIGGDKALTYFPVQEANPYLGWRGIRISLDNPDIFLTQIRAMLKANAGLGNLRLLLPMISRVEDLDEAIVLINGACHELQNQQDDIMVPPLGVMIEVPAAVYQAQELARRVEFLCVGTNDLTQYLLAVDRNNERVARWFDALHPAVIRALIQVTDAARRHGKPVCVCGEAAGDPAVALLLLGLGVESLSLSSGDLPRIKWVIRSFSRDQGQELLSLALAQEQATSIRALLLQALTTAGLGALVHPGTPR